MAASLTANQEEQESRSSTSSNLASVSTEAKKSKREKKKKKKKKSKKKNKKRRQSSSTASEDDDEADQEHPPDFEAEVKSAMRKQMQEANAADEVGLDERNRRGYHSNYETKAPTEAELEAHARLRTREEDPMNFF